MRSALLLALPILCFVLWSASGLRAEGSGYVGDEVCVACHEALDEDFQRHWAGTIHAKALTEVNARTPLMTRGCEACHGPGQQHVEEGGGRDVGGMISFRDDTPEEVERGNTACLQCHAGEERRYWTGSVHHTRDVGCASCHTVMRTLSERALLSEKTQVATCSGCHPIQKARIYRNAHMPLRPGAFQSSTATGGKLSCGSCHNPHGTVSEKLIAHVTVNESCLSCHADKRGPFLWEHAPVTEDCLNCHDPHGSTRENMLELDLPRLCTSCHGTGHAGSPRDASHRFVVGTSCLQCHQKVHGSNHPSGRRFLR